MSWTSNSISSLFEYLVEGISSLYAPREAKNIAHLTFEHLFNASRTDILLSPDRRLSESEMLQVREVKQKLLAHEPIQHILGKAYFRDFELEVDKNVLIPRPETEELVQLVLDQEDQNRLSIVDVGTGSGCIALALAKHNANWHVSGVDVSAKALATAKRNGEKYAVEITWLEQDFLQKSLPTKYNVLVSNPPYIGKDEAKTLMEHVHEHEPHLALFSPTNDPLLFYRHIAENASDFLTPGGRIYLEINENWGKESLALFQNDKFEHASLHKDMQGKPRFVCATLK